MDGPSGATRDLFKGLWTRFKAAGKTHSQRATFLCSGHQRAAGDSSQSTGSEPRTRVQYVSARFCRTREAQQVA